MEKKKKAALKIIPVLYAAGNSVVILNFAVWLPQKAAVQKKKGHNICSRYISYIDIKSRGKICCVIHNSSLLSVAFYITLYSLCEKFP